MSTGDNREKRTDSPAPTQGQPQPASSAMMDSARSVRRQPSASNLGQGARPVRAAAAAAASTFAAAAAEAAAANRVEPSADPEEANRAAEAAAAKAEKRVTMVTWSSDDRKAITAVSDHTLKIWDSNTGSLLSTLVGHEDEIFVLEPHPVSVNILLSAAHDGQICVWDMATLKCLYKYRNIVENQGHAAVFDAKWSHDGTMICASDSHGHLHFIGHGSASRYQEFPPELFFHTDYRPLLRDQFHNVVDEQTQLPPHLMPPPFLVDSDGAPYPAYIQKKVPGRGGLSDTEALLPFGADVGPPLLQELQQRLQEENAVQQEVQNENQERPLQMEHLMSNDSNSSSLPESERDRSDTDNSGPDRRVDGGRDEQPGTSGQGSRRGGRHVPPLSLIVLHSRLKRQELAENLKKIKEMGYSEIRSYAAESFVESFDHDYTGHSLSRQRMKKSRGRGGARRQRLASGGRTSGSRGARVENEDQGDEEEEEENQETRQNGDEDDDTSDMSLDESDFTDESTTEISEEHSDWGSDEQDETPRKTPTTVTSPPTKKRSPKNKRSRKAAQKCRELMLLPGADLDAYAFSAWLAETHPKKAPYVPQIGDILMYFKRGHQKYLELVKERNVYKIPASEKRELNKIVADSYMVKVATIRFDIRPGVRLVKLKLNILDQATGALVGDSFDITYHDMNDVVDFLVLHQIYNRYRGKHWKKGDRIRCQIDDKWWKGSIQKVDNHEKSKLSPFLSIHVHWDNNEKEFLSPWDLEALDADSEQMDDGTEVTPEENRSSLYVPTSEEWNGIGRDSECERIADVLESIMSLAIAEPFNFPVDTTQYPEYLADVEYPVDLSLIKARVESHYYRRIDSILFDLKKLFENAASFNQPRSTIVRNAKIIWQTASEIVSSPNKSKDDVSAIYHRLVETFQWSEDDEDVDDEDGSNDEGDGNGDRRRSRRARGRPMPKANSSKLNPKQWKIDCKLLIEKVFENPLSEPFREPVSEIEYPDYHKYISTPMDFSMIRESLMCGNYDSPAEMQKEVALIFKNSRSYNTNPKSKVLSMTVELERWFDKRMAQVIHDWKGVKRKLAHGEPKSPKYKGKGKGLGKGQSNRIKSKKPKRRLRSSGDESESESESQNETESEAESDFSDEVSKTQKRSTRVKTSPVVAKRSSIAESHFDPENPLPCSSRSLGRSTRSTTATTDPSKSRPEDESSPEVGSRRASSRPHRPPARYLDDSPQPQTHQMELRDSEDNESDDDEQPLASKNRSKKKIRNEQSSDHLATSSTGRPVRNRKPKKSDEDFKYLSDDSEGDDPPQEDDEKEVPDLDSDEEKPLVQRKVQKRKAAVSGDQTAPKRSRKVATSESEEELPLATRRAVTVEPSTSKPARSLSTFGGPRSTRSDGGARPVRAARVVKSLAESEDEIPPRPVRPRRDVVAVTSRFEHDSSEDDHLTRRNRRPSTQRGCTLPSKKRKKQSEESESEFSEDESEVEDEEEVDEEFSEIDDDDFIDDDDDADVDFQRSRPRRQPRTVARNSLRSRSSGVSSKRPREALDSDVSDDDSVGGRRRKSRLTNRNSAPHAKKRNFRSSVGRVISKKPNYHEDQTDYNSSSERENRRPVRRSTKRSRVSDSENDSDAEESLLHKTRITSRGRVCKPNPRIS